LEGIAKSRFLLVQTRVQENTANTSKMSQQVKQNSTQINQKLDPKTTPKTNMNNNAFLVRKSFRIKPKSAQGLQMSAKIGPKWSQNASPRVPLSGKGWPDTFHSRFSLKIIEKSMKFIENQ